MLTIRLFRIGTKNQPAFKIVVTDKRRSSTRGRFVEEVGVYNPLTKQRNLKGDRIKYWISMGAQPSPSVHNMLITDKVIEGKKIAKHKLVPTKPEQPIAEAPVVIPAAPATPTSEAAPTPEAPQEATPPTEAAPTPETPQEEPKPAEEAKK